jgi:hypothetical protein
MMSRASNSAGTSVGSSWDRFSVTESNWLVNRSFDNMDDNVEDQTRKSDHG